MPPYILLRRLFRHCIHLVPMCFQKLRLYLAHANGIDTKLSNAETIRRFGAKDLELTKDEGINVACQKEHQSCTVAYVCNAITRVCVLFNVLVLSTLHQEHCR
jgi:hypothetical protein